MNVSDLNAIADRADRDRSEIRTQIPRVAIVGTYVESDPKIFEERFARCRHLLYFLAVRILGSEGSSGCCLYGDNEAYALGISDWFLRTR
jgi:hypothetical protein